MSEERARGSWLRVDQDFSLEVVGRMLKDAFGWSTYLVGSVLRRQDYRDVDLRCILDDVDYDGMFGGNELRLKLLNAALTEWIATRTGLPIDFQFQRRTEANAEFDGQRSALGALYFHWSNKPS